MKGGTARAVSAHWRNRLAGLAAHQVFIQLDYALCAEGFEIVGVFSKEILCLTKLETSRRSVNPCECRKLCHFLERPQWPWPASGLVLGGRPRGLLRARMAPWWKISPPQTPHGSARSSAPARQAARSGHCWQHALACSSSSGSSENHSSPPPRWQGSGSASAAGGRLVCWQPSRSRWCGRHGSSAWLRCCSPSGPASRPGTLSSCDHGEVKTSATWPICRVPSHGRAGGLRQAARPSEGPPADQVTWLSWVSGTSSVRAPPEAVRCAGRLQAARPVA